MVPVVIVLAAGTIVEKYHGNDFATQHIYGSWWFVVLMAAVAVAVIVSIIRNKMWHTPYKMFLFSSVVVILLGGALTKWTGRHGSMTLVPDLPNASFTTQRGENVSLPFAVTLDRFEVMTYPGSHAPMDFISHITVEGQKADISMNKIFRHKGYRFYQEDYDGEGGSTLSVAFDPWGITVTYIGYGMLLLGLVLMFASRESAFRKLLKGMPLLVLLFIGCCAQAAPRTLPRQTAAKMGEMYVLYKGRICPMQTLAKDFTTKLYGRPTYKGLTSEQVLGGWIFYFGEWCDEPVIKLKGKDVREALEMQGRCTSYNNLDLHAGLFEQHGLDKNMRTAQEKYQLVQMVLNSSLLKIYPSTDSVDMLTWYSQNDPLPTTIGEEEYIFIRKQLGYCQELVVKGDFESLNHVFEKTLAYQQKKAGARLPSKTKVAAERLYNRLTTGRWLAMVGITIGLLCFALFLFGSGRREHSHPNKVFRVVLPVLLVALLTAFQLLIMILRWVAGGHAPMAGGFDSMNLMAIGIGILSLCLTRRYAAAPSIGLLAMGLCLLVAMMSGSNPPVTHLMPVLSHPLLTLHVSIIMMAYALFIFVMLNSVGALLRPSHAEEAERTNLLMLYPAVALLAVGIILGAVWANISWGSYWSWDPKEVWALITLIVYLYPVFQSQNPDHSAKGLHIYCVLAFLSVLVTYFGVNFLLGGIHAYN